MTRARTVALVTAGLLLLASSSSVATDEYGVTFESNMPVKMRDGVTLRADIYRPNTAGKFPVLLQRTPYNKDGDVGFGLKAAARGYVVIIQDVRGRYASEGEWYTFKHESNDGYDTVEWAAALPHIRWQSGYVRWLLRRRDADARGDCASAASGWHLSLRHGEQLPLELDLPGRRLRAVVQRVLDLRPGAERARSRRQQSHERDEGHLATAGGLVRPVQRPRRRRHDQSRSNRTAPYFLDWLAHPSEDAYWKQWSIEAHFSEITVPQLTIAAWYDIFQDGSIRNYVGVKAHGATEAARRGQHLLVAVGGHAGEGPKIGEVDFGPDSHFDYEAATLAWYDYLFKDAKNEFAGKPVKIFVMGANQWREEDDWPLARAQATRYFLHSTGKANSVRGNGTLSTAAPGATEAADQYVYDPANPAPTVGGPLCCDGEHMPPGPRDQRPVEAREDVLVYSTAPLASDMEVTGPVSLELYIKSSAVDTDFTAKLVDVWPNGFAQNLTDSILRTRYRNSQEKPELMTPGQVYKLTIDVWSTSNVFKKGHALRLEVSSSNFPRFDRNLNTGEDNGTGPAVRAGDEHGPPRRATSLCADAARGAAAMNR